MERINLNIGDTVHYGAHGVCRVFAREIKDIGAGKKEYYLLNPVSEEHIELFLPADADPERVRLRKVLSAEEICAIVAREKDWHKDWVSDSKLRRELSTKTLRSGDTVELIRMVKVLHAHAESLPAGKSLPTSELEQMRSAEKQLYNELCFVLDITKEQVLPFILGEIQLEGKNIS